VCLAIPGKVIECAADEALVDFHGNTLRVSTVLTPQVRVGSWVLVHAGFAITELDEQEARETWDYLRQALADEPRLADGTPAAPSTGDIQPPPTVPGAEQRDAGGRAHDDERGPA